MKLNRAISFKDVSCRYAEADEPALRDINIVIPACKTIGIVGASGAGKSTFVDVLAGLLPLETGRILIDDVPLTDSNVRLWRRSIGYVAQQIYLADDTIRRNIAFGVADADIDEHLIERAARLASIHDFIMDEMPDRYDTIIGENGVRLSGGQRQRLGIARALYRNPSVLVFDEATSALDGITEDAVDRGNPGIVLAKDHRHYRPSLRDGSALRQHLFSRQRPRCRQRDLFRAVGPKQHFSADGKGG